MESGGTSYNEDRGKGSHVLRSDHIDFYNICMREPRVYIDHRMILEELRGCGEWWDLI